ncbi:MAG: tetratricopeptide repeat protein [Kofleriaceae bacterium]
MNKSPVFVLVLVASSVAPTPTFGAPHEKQTIVFESHVGVRPANLAPFLHAVNDLLETRGYAAFPATVLRLAGNNLPRPGILDSKLTSPGLAELHNGAFALYKAAQWSDALRQLVDARDKSQRNPALVANDIGNHDQMFRTLVAIADCYKRLGDERAALEAMKEVRRVYPTRPVSRTDAWGPSGEQLYMTVALDERGVLRGRLSIAAGDPNAQIAVEGQLRGVGNVSLADLLPGVYRVFIRTSARDSGRQYEVTVKPGEETRFVADINRDELLDASSEYVALTYPSEGARKDECKLASHFAERWTASGATLVLASGQENGRPIVTGIRCRDGVQVRRATIFTDSEDSTTPEKLVPFLDDLTAEGPSWRMRDVGTSKGPRWPKLALGTSAVVLAGSAALYLAWPKDDHIQLEFDDTGKSIATHAYTGAAIVAGVGVYGWLTGSRHMRRWPAALFSASTTSLLLAAFYIPADEDPDNGSLPDGYQIRPRYLDSGPTGVVLLGAGVGLAVGGLLAWRLGTEPSSEPPKPAAVPVVAPTHEGVSVGWSFTF